MSNAPIGVFDSGVGGLTVARAIMDVLPHESLHYVGDTRHGPYGPLPIEEVRAHALGIMEKLVRDGAKIVVIACNSASAAVAAEIREEFTRAHGVPVVEVIAPAARRATALTKNNKVGVIGTVATITSSAYDQALAGETSITVTSQACPRFVELVEAGVTSGPKVLEVAREYLAPLTEAGVDTVILGCTHYPMLSGALGFVLGDEVTLVDSASETARDVFAALEQSGMHADAGNVPQHRFFATGETARFEELSQRFLGPVVSSVEVLDS